MAELDPRLAEQIAKVTAHRARTVIDHIAMEQRRRVDLHWVGDEVSEYDAFQNVARKAGMSVQDWIRHVCKQAAQS